MARIKLGEFARRVGISESMASRLRKGDRLPSNALLKRIIDEFSLDLREALDAFALGRIAFGAYLRRVIFDVDRELCSTSG
jgi:transcriptional regulator with XRE-family HTH domain